MRLTFVISGFSEQSITALPWKYVFELARSLAGKGHGVQIITDEPEFQVGAEGITVNRVSRRMQWSTLSPVMDPRQVDEMVEEFSSDLMCVFGDSLVGYFVRRLRSKVPLVVNVSKGIHPLRQLDFSAYFSLYFFFSNSPFARFVVRLLNQRKIRAVTVPTLTIRRRLEECGVEGSKIVVLPMVLDKEVCTSESASADRDQVRAELGFGAKDFVVGYFGPPFVRRGVNDLIRAVASLKREFSVRLLLLLRVHDGRKSREVESLSRLASELDFADRVTVIASVLTRDKLKGYLGSCDVVALPFRYVDEEPPLGVLEAMALGKPVITTDIDSLPEILSNYRGILVRPGNANDLSKAVRCLFEHEDIARSMTAEGIKYVQTLKNWDELADYFLRLAESLSA